LENKIDGKKQLRKIRQCFIYEGKYFMVETYTNVDGAPSILRVESAGENNRLKIPPFVKVLKEVTDNP